MRLQQGSVAALLCLSLMTVGAQASPPAEVDAFTQKMVTEHGIDAKKVEQLLGQAKLNEDVLAAIQRPWEAKPWHQYYPIFLTEKRINAGVKFWQTYQAELARAEAEYGVPAEMIVAIIGVETFYGNYTGNYKVLDALYTLGFHYPPRQTFFRSELEQFMLLTAEESLDPLAIKGSYAGAMGWGQFISSSYRHYAVDFDGDGVRDLLNNPIDAIGSVANYFREHGWQPGEPVSFKLSSAPEAVLETPLKPSQRVTDLAAAGVKDIPAQVSADTPVRVLNMEAADGRQYWLTLPNFYVITRYNHSPLYAMAVYELSQSIASAFTQQATLTTAE